MHLYHYTVQKPTSINHAVYGSFSVAKANEILVAKGQLLELYQITKDNQFQLLCSQEVFGYVRCISCFRMIGSSRDHIVVGSDSGRIVILDYDEKKEKFIKLHQETYGKTGCRRIVPGQYLAVDPAGRAVMIGAIEKQKFVYVLNRDGENNLTISSPLEAHKSHTVCYCMVALDVAYENPAFACIEVDHSESDQTPTIEGYKLAKKVLSIYELDLALNTVVKKQSIDINETSHYLMAVPGGSDGPGGVLVCSENLITYIHPDKKPVEAEIPIREKMADKRGLMILSSSSHHRKDKYFFIMQSEMGDLYKVDIDIEKDMSVAHIHVRYFDTIPVATSICITKNGCLFSASEFGDHKLYKFKGIGENKVNLSTKMIETAEGSKKVSYFKVKPLKNLEQIQELAGLSPILDYKVDDLLNERVPQFYVLSGRGSRSSLRILRHGLAINELAVSGLNGTPTAVWTIKGSYEGKFDKYIVISFSTSTLVLSIGENVQQVFDSGFHCDKSTISASTTGSDSFVQVHPEGISLIHSKDSINEWSAGSDRIVKAAVNKNQIAITFNKANTSEIVYFEIDVATGKLEEIARKSFTDDITCVAIGTIPEGQHRSRFLAIGFSNKTLKIFSLNPTDTMTVLSRQSLTEEPSSIIIAEMDSTLYLNVGLNNGMLMRTVIDKITGELSDTRVRYLGSKAVKLSIIQTKGFNSVLALSSRSWLSYNYQSKHHLTPISYVPLEHASAFVSDQCPDCGIVAITSNELRVFRIEQLGDLFNQTVVPLKYTPRKLAINRQYKKIVILETDHNAIKISDKKGDHMDIEENEQKERDVKELEVEDDELPESEYGSEKTMPHSSKWASYIRVYDPVSNKTTELLELQNNEAAFSITLTNFAKAENINEQFLVVGTSKDLQLYPRKSTCGFIHVYRFVDGGKRLKLFHKTQVEDIPYALCPYQGYLLAGVKNKLRMYNLGQKKLLLKCEQKSFTSFIQSLWSEDDRIFVGDMNEGFHFVKYSKSENKFILFADDTTPRWLTSSVQLDYDTMAGADKFGNIFISRLPENTSDDLENEYSSSNQQWMWERGYLNGASQRSNQIVQFHVGDVITCMAKTNLVPASPGALTYMTVSGAIGVLVPFVTQSDTEFFTLLEMQMRRNYQPLCGREHLAFRSYYFPVKNVIDGDFCEQFLGLENDKKKTILEELERQPNEVLKKLEDMRNQAF